MKNKIIKLWTDLGRNIFIGARLENNLKGLWYMAVVLSAREQEQVPVRSEDAVVLPRDGLYPAKVLLLGSPLVVEFVLHHPEIREVADNGVHGLVAHGRHRLKAVVIYQPNHDGNL